MGPDRLAIRGLGIAHGWLIRTVYADATANRWGYTWQLGHPVEPAHLWFLSECTTAQGDTQSSSNAVFGSALASTSTEVECPGEVWASASAMANWSNSRLRIGPAARPWRSHAAGRASAGQPS